MLLSTKHLTGFKIEAKDGEIGDVHSFLIDDQSWIVRYIVVDTGTWLPGRKVLIAPSAAESPNGAAKSLPLHLTKKQVEESPEMDTDMPVSRSQEIKLHQHYQWIPYWASAATPLGPGYVPPPATLGKEIEDSSNAEEVENADPHLRSTKEIIGYAIHASDGKIGHLADFIVDSSDWVIRYFIVDTGSWLSGKKVIISPGWIQDISWTESAVALSMTSAEIKGSPEYDHSIPINMEYEARLYDYYGRPKYWE